MFSDRNPKSSIFLKLVGHPTSSKYFYLRFSWKVWKKNSHSCLGFSRIKYVHEKQEVLLGSSLKDNFQITDAEFPCEENISKVISISTCFLMASHSIRIISLQDNLSNGDSQYSTSWENIFTTWSISCEIQNCRSLASQEWIRVYCSIVFSDYISKNVRKGTFTIFSSSFNSRESSEMTTP